LSWCSHHIRFSAAALRVPPRAGFCVRFTSTNQLQTSWIQAQGNEKAPLGPHDPVFAPPRHFLLEDSAMRNLLRHARHLLVNEDGPTAVEYAVMLALIIVVCLTAITAIGTNANATFQSVADKLPTGAAS